MMDYHGEWPEPYQGGSLNLLCCCLIRTSVAQFEVWRLLLPSNTAEAFTVCWPSHLFISSVAVGTCSQKTADVTQTVIHFLTTSPSFAWQKLKFIHSYIHYTNTIGLSQCLTGAGRDSPTPRCVAAIDSWGLHEVMANKVSLTLSNRIGLY